MSWVNDLVSAAGLPVGAATLAVAVYAACAEAEKAARPDALKDIGRILKDPTWERSVRPSAIIERIFVYTFGRRHLSWKCFRRSILISLSTIITLVMVYHLHWKINFVTPSALGSDKPGAGTLLVRYCLSCLGFVLFGLLPDYVALGKTRYLLKGMKEAAFSPALILATDVAISLLIGLCCATGSLMLWNWAANLLAHSSNSSWTTELLRSFMPLVGTLFDKGDGTFEMRTTNNPDIWAGTEDTLLNLFRWSLHGNANWSPLLPVFLLSTLFTSIWTCLILAATILLKLLAPLHRFTGWFFDVDRHPVKAIGIMAGTLVMIVSLIWSGVWALI